MTSLSTNLVASKERNPNRVALRCDDLQFTFAEFDAAAARVATLLEQAGVEPGDRVGVMLPNTPAFAIVFYGIIYRGAVAVPMNPLLKAREVTYYLSNSGAKALFGTPAFADEATAGADEVGAQCWIVDDAGLMDLIAGLPEQESPVERGHDDVAVILHTSGTTGKPKGAMLTHGNLGRNADVSVRTLVETGPGRRGDGLPAAISRVRPDLWPQRGGAVGCDVDADPSIRPAQGARGDRAGRRHGVRGCADDVFGAAERGRPGCSRRRRAPCGSASPVVRRCPCRFSPTSKKLLAATVLEGYGLSESSPAAAFNHPHRERKVGSIGTPIEGVQMRVVDLDGAEVPQGQTGEIQIRGHNVMKGYWNLPDATKATITPDGWLATGDVGRVDEDGYFYIVDRTKD